MKYCIDPGHGFSDPGAIGSTGLKEKDVVLSISKFVLLGLQQSGHDGILTREGDFARTLQERCDIANNTDGVDRFVSIHANSFSDPAANGFEVWTSPGWTPADPIATNVFNYVRETFPNLRGRVDASDGDPDKESKFYVLIHTNMPAILVETAFISNPKEQAWLRDVGWQMRMAGAILSGITTP